MASQCKTDMVAKRRQLDALRKATLPKHDPAELSKTILEWADRDDSMSMAQFCVEYKIVPQRIWDYDKLYPDFHDAYELTKLTLAVRREAMLNCESLNYGAWMKSASMYDTFIRKHEEDVADAEAERRAGIAKEERMNLVQLAKLCSEGKISQI